MPTFEQALSEYGKAIEKEKPFPALLGAYINGAFRIVVPTNPALAYVRHLDNTPATAYHHNNVDLALDVAVAANQSKSISLYYDEYDHLAIWGLAPPEAGASLESDPNSGAGGVKRIIAGANVTVDNTDPVNPVVSATGGGGGGTGDYILIREEQAQNTDAGTFTSGAWQPRVLNTIVSNVGGHASLSSNRITLAAGTYRATIWCPALGVRQNQARLQDITNAATLLIGTNSYAAPNDPNFAAFSQSVIEGRFTLSGSTVLEVQHQCNSTVSTFGFGAACNFTTEIYTVVELIKE